MDLIFAKLVFFTAVTLQPSADAPWPVMAPAILGGGITLEAPDTTGDPSLPPAAPVQAICVPVDGLYSVSVQVGVSPAAHPANGWLLVSTPQDSAIVAKLAADPGSWDVVGATVAVALKAGQCITLRYSATEPIPINWDPRVTRLTIHRAGQ